MTSTQTYKGYTLLWNDLGRAKVIERQRPGVPWVFDTETDGLEVYGPVSRDRAWYAGFLCSGTGAVFLFDRAVLGEQAWAEVVAWANTLKLVAHNAKFDIHAMDLSPEQDWLDTMAVFYRDNTEMRKGLDDLAPLYKWKKVKTPPELKGKKGSQNRIHELPKEAMGQYLADDVIFTDILYRDQPQESWDRYHAALDGEVARCAWLMEGRGIVLDVPRLAALRERLVPLQEECVQALRAAGFSGNLNSPVQVKEWLAALGYEGKLTMKKWVGGKRTEVYSTDTGKVLQPYLSRNHDPLIESLVSYRAWTKKIRDFCDGLPKKLDRDGILRGVTNITGPRTTRLSISRVPLHQIPKRDKTPKEQELRISKEFRKCFHGESGWTTVSDFGQIEMRLAAALSGDETLLEIFDSGKNFHTGVACAVFERTEATLAQHEYDASKAISFGILNLMGAERLAGLLGCSTREAQLFLDRWLARFPKLHQWMEDVTYYANETCRAITTLDKACRVYPESVGRINSAVSMKVQGNAAMIMRRALVATEEAGLRPILSVHDEIVCDKRGVHDELKEVMEHAANTTPYPELQAVRFTADADGDRTWGDPRPR